MTTLAVVAAGLNIDLIFQGLIYLCVLVLLIWVVLWVVSQLGINLPANVLHILWVIVGLLVLWWVLKNILPGLGLHI